MTQLAFEDFIKIVGEQLGVDPKRITRESHLVNDLGVDSIALVNIVAELEAFLDTEFEDLDFDDIHTIEQAFARFSA